MKHQSDMPAYQNYLAQEYGPMRNNHAAMKAYCQIDKMDPERERLAIEAFRRSAQRSARHRRDR